jgi:hypothetical protein
MGVQDTASKTHLLLNCPRPFAADTPIEHQEAGEASRYGSALHEAVEHLLNGTNPPDLTAKWSLPTESAAAISAHASQVVMLLQRWLAGENDWMVQFTVTGVERHLATRLMRKAGGIQARTRECDFSAEDHQYDLTSYEFGGTYDIQADAPGGLRAILDIKTGEEDWHGGNFAEPKTIDQLMTLAVMTGANIVGVIHAPRGEPPEIYAAEVSEQELQAHAKKRRAAMALVESGFLRTGPQCRYCPARPGCPAKDAELLTRASALVKSVTAAPLALPVELGEFHQMYQEMKRVMARAGDEMKIRVKEDAVNGIFHERPDGEIMQIQTSQRPNLSMASIRRALPAEKAERLIASLKKKGCIEMSAVESLVSRKP